jgi:hypothetical protein
MKKQLLILTTTVLCLGLTPAFAQFGRTPSGPKFDGAMAKLFGDNHAFSATLENEIKPTSGDLITMPGKMAFDSGKARIEMNMADAKGLKMPPSAAAQMKAMGFDQMVTLSLPETKSVYLIYPGLESYVESPVPAANTTTNDTFNLTVKEIGQDTVDGHPCLKNDVVVTDAKGATNEFTVWNATDLNKFPVKIFRSEQGMEITMLFKNISLTKPAAANFEVPAGYRHYDNVQTMMQTEMMKKMGSGMGMPPAH